MVASAAKAMTVTMSAPAQNAISASARPASIIFKIRDQRQLRMRLADPPQGIHPFAEHQRRPHLGNIDKCVDISQDIQRRRQVAIQRDLQLRHKQPIGSRTGENRTQYSIVNRRSMQKEASMTAKIVVVGSFNADLVSYMKRMPRPGETVHGDRFATGAGGKGSNQAVAAARLGADVSFIGRLGNDVFANLAYEIWDAERVNYDFVNRDSEVATGVAPILVDSSGENMIVVVLGANRRLRASDIDAARGADSCCRHAGGSVGSEPRNGTLRAKNSQRIWRRHDSESGAGRRQSHLRQFNWPIT